MTHPIVLIEWMDIHNPPCSWEEKDYAIKHEPMMCKSVGFLLFRGEKKVITAQNMSEDGDFNTIEVIPAGCIKSIKRL